MIAPAMTGETLLLLLFTVATAVAILARRYNLPYTVALVVAGLLLGSLHALAPPHLTRELLFAVFLPGLLFEAAFHLDFSQFWRDRVAIAALAVPGVLGAIAFTALLLAPLLRVLGDAGADAWAVALVFGAVIAATDPIAVTATFRRLGAPACLRVLVEGESLLNDGTSIVFFSLVVAYVTSTGVTAAATIVSFLSVVGIGALAGAAVGVAVSLTTRHVDDAMIEITLTTLAAYGAFVLAEAWQGSGVIATVTAGMICGNYGARTGMSPATRVSAETFWQYVAFALNSLVFLLIGFEVRLPALGASWREIAAAFVAVTLGRGVMLWLLGAALHPTRWRIPRRWRVVLAWGGLRGALSMVLALALPVTLPRRGLLVTMTFGAVIVSILAQGLTMEPLVRRLGIARRSERRARYEQLRASRAAIGAALAALDHMTRTHAIGPDVARVLCDDYERRRADVDRRLTSLEVDARIVRDEELDRARRRLILVEKERLIEELQDGLIGQDAYDRLLGDADARLLRLETGEGTEPEKAAPSGGGARGEDAGPSAPRAP